MYHQHARDGLRASPPPAVLPKYTYNPLDGNSVYAFDLGKSPTGNYLAGKRPIYTAEEFRVDGFGISRNGYLIGAAGVGVDVLTPTGELVLRTQILEVVNNVQFTGKEREELWLFGFGGIDRVNWNLTGMLED